MWPIFLKIYQLQKILFDLSLSGRRVENLKISSFDLRVNSFLKNALFNNLPWNTESSLAITMEKNLPIKNWKTLKISDEKQSWKSENCEINYHIRTPKASFGLKMRLMKSTKTGLFKIIIIYRLSKKQNRIRLFYDIKKYFMDVGI